MDDIYLKTVHVHWVLFFPPNILVIPNYHRSAYTFCIWRSLKNFKIPTCMTFCINIRLTSVSLKVITHVHWNFSLEYSTCMYLKTELLISCFMLLWKKKSRLCSTLFRYSVQAIPNVCVILVNIFIIPPC